MTQLKNQIITLCNNSGLPLEAIMFVLKDAYRDAVDNLAIAEAKEKAEYNAEKIKEKVPKVDGEEITED